MILQILKILELIYIGTIKNSGEHCYQDQRLYWCLGDGLLSHPIFGVFDLFCFVPWGGCYPRPTPILSGSVAVTMNGSGARVSGGIYGCGERQSCLFPWAAGLNTHTAGISDQGSSSEKRPLT